MNFDDQLLDAISAQSASAKLPHRLPDRSICKFMMNPFAIVRFTAAFFAATRAVTWLQRPLR